ncbi:hypothetical protein DEJ21_05970 [Curtobacterium sp. MCSS17_006]|nr:hypothetical protein DEJ21_05970 [Curtobacterium sp. MCSS17_006]
MLDALTVVSEGSVDAVDMVADDAGCLSDAAIGDELDRPGGDSLAASARGELREAVGKGVEDVPVEVPARARGGEHRKARAVAVAEELASVVQEKAVLSHETRHPAARGHVAPALWEVEEGESVVFAEVAHVEQGDGVAVGMALVGDVDGAVYPDSCGRSEAHRRPRISARTSSVVSSSELAALRAVSASR